MGWCSSSAHSVTSNCSTPCQLCAASFPTLFPLRVPQVINRMLRSSYWRETMQEYKTCFCPKRETKCKQVHHLLRFISSGAQLFRRTVGAAAALTVGIPQHV